VSDYRLDDRGSIPRRGKRLFSSLCVQTSSDAHPDSYPTATGVLSREVKRGWGVTLIAQSYLVPRLRMSRSYIPLHLVNFTAVVTMLIVAFMDVTQCTFTDGYRCLWDVSLPFSRLCFPLKRRWTTYKTTRRQSSDHDWQINTTTILDLLWS
jgi:hypothetical protein